ncbi:Uncharacterised protein [Candidatus Gugararchaeum adminiculabundum]|nr:Uncharacterised protein [Candidatus Gugararchaeum adminiculabundum]
MASNEGMIGQASPKQSSMELGFVKEIKRAGVYACLEKKFREYYGKDSANPEIEKRLLPFLAWVKQNESQLLPAFVKDLGEGNVALCQIVNPPGEKPENRFMTLFGAWLGVRYVADKYAPGEDIVPKQITERGQGFYKHQWVAVTPLAYLYTNLEPTDYLLHGVNMGVHEGTHALSESKKLYDLHEMDPALTSVFLLPMKIKGKKFGKVPESERERGTPNLADVVWKLGARDFYTSWKILNRLEGEEAAGMREGMMGDGNTPFALAVMSWIRADYGEDGAKPKLHTVEKREDRNFYTNYNLNDFAQQIKEFLKGRQDSKSRDEIILNLNAQIENQLGFSKDSPVAGKLREVLDKLLERMPKNGEVADVQFIELFIKTMNEVFGKPRELDLPEGYVVLPQEGKQNRLGRITPKKEAAA